MIVAKGKVSVFIPLATKCQSGYFIRSSDSARNILAYLSVQRHLSKKIPMPPQSLIEYLANSTNNPPH